MGENGSPRTVWSCILDDTPQIWEAFPVWVASLMACAGVSPDDIVVHHVSPLNPTASHLCAHLGLRTVSVDRFDARSPHANKILQCQSDFGDASRVILSDVDIAVLGPLPLDYVTAPIAGKVVDFPHPPLELLESLFALAGLGKPHQRVTGRYVDNSGCLRLFETMPANFNGGLYILDRVIIGSLGEAWARLTSWLLEEAPPLGSYSTFVDQVGFAMAVHALRLDSQVLDSQWNLPSHVRTDPLDAPPLILHHHGRLDRLSRLLPLKPVRHATRVMQANQAISTFMADLN